MDDILIRLLGSLVIQSFLAIGGIYVILAELQRVVVVENGWMTIEEFTSLFALAQAAPGPNTLFISLIGWRIGGIWVGILATIVFVTPSLVLAAALARGWSRWAERPWFALLRRGLIPVTIGLLTASAVLLTEAAATGPGALAVTAGAAALSLTTRLPPVAILGMAAAVGAIGLV
ncbi:MAG: chromate transporter [Roseicyclus sp.]|jgi:chromate transporter